MNCPSNTQTGIPVFLASSACWSCCFTCLHSIFRGCAPRKNQSTCSLLSLLPLKSLVDLQVGSPRHAECPSGQGVKGCCATPSLKIDQGFYSDPGLPVAQVKGRLSSCPFCTPSAAADSIRGNQTSLAADHKANLKS